MMEVRGAVLKTIPKFIRKKFGKKGLEQWLDTISVEAYTAYNVTIDNNEWYPLKKVLIEPTANIAQLFYQWNLKDAAWECGSYSAESALSGMNRVLVKMGSVESLIQKATEIFPTYYRPCAMELGDQSDGFVSARITQFPEMDKTTEYRIAGWIQRAMEINGCKDVTVEIPVSLTSFEPYTEYKVSWTVS